MRGRVSLATHHGFSGVVFSDRALPMSPIVSKTQPPPEVCSHRHVILTGLMTRSIETEDVIASNHSQVPLIPKAQVYNEYYGHDNTRDECADHHHLCYTRSSTHCRRQPTAPESRPCPVIEQGIPTDPISFTSLRISPPQRQRQCSHGHRAQYVLRWRPQVPEADVQG